MHASFYQVRFHGRGGQGVVTAAELLSIAAFMEGKHAQAFPSFGSERMGAPVMAFCRISDREIRLREPVYNPDALIVQDASLLPNGDLLAGLGSTRIVLVNSATDVDELDAGQLKSKVSNARIFTVPATEIALDVVKRNVPNVIMLSAFAAASGLLSFETLARAVEKKFPKKVAELNLRAAEKAWDLVACKCDGRCNECPHCDHDSDPAAEVANA